MFVGVDIGFGNVKLYDDRGKTIIASHLGEPRVRVVESEVEDPDTIAVQIGSVEYMVGERVAVDGRERPAFGLNRLVTGDGARAVLYAGLTKRFLAYGKYTKPIDVYVGVPAQLLNCAGAKANIAAIQAWLVGSHEWKFRGKKQDVVINSVTVRTQANGALGDMIHNLQGQQTRDAEFVQKGLGIISVGFNTVELSGAIYGSPASGMVGSSIHGVRSLLELYNSEEKIANLDLEYRRGIMANQRPEHAELVREWSSRIVSFIDQTWQENLPNIKRVYLVGGGAKDASAAITARLGDIVVTPDDPYISVARGLYKWAVKNGKK